MGFRKSPGTTGGTPRLELLPGWGTAALAFGSLGVTLNSVMERRDWAGGADVAKTGLWYFGLLLNVGLIVAGVHYVVSLGVTYWERWREANCFIDRTWQILTQGAATAGLVGKDLGEADQDGIYKHQTRSGGVLYLRPTTDLGGTESWEWSFDRKMWLPSSKADHFWNGKYGVSPAAHKILVRRLQVECALRAQQPVCPAPTHPPPIELDLSWKDKERIVKEAPKEYLCPMSMEIMTEPVVTPSGVTYNRPAVEEWIDEHHSDPASKMPLLHDHLYPNLAIRDMIQRWLVDNKYVQT